jgi:hypothetical protein
VTACTREPISWLRLERYALGELPGVEHSEVSRHLAECPACNACFARIEHDPVPQLTFLEVAAGRRAQRRGLRWTAWVGLASAAAAAFLLMRPASEPLPGARLHVKGGDFALEVVRLDAENRAQEATHFDPADRFKALVTCPPAWRGAVGIVVYQAGKTYVPLSVRVFDECGNRRPLPGAFKLDGDARALVCASFASTESEWRERINRSAGGPPEGSVCAPLEPSADSSADTGARSR